MNLFFIVVAVWTMLFTLGAFVLAKYNARWHSWLVQYPNRVIAVTILPVVAWGVFTVVVFASDTPTRQECVDRSDCIVKEVVTHKVCVQVPWWKGIGTHLEICDMLED